MKKLILAVFVLAALAVTSNMMVQSKTVIASDCCEMPNSGDTTKPKPKEKRA